MKNKHLIINLGIAVVIGAIAFYGGTKYGEGKTQSAAPSGFAGGQGTQMRNRGGGAFQGGFTNGEVVSKDSESITLKLRDGSSRVVFFASSTQVSKSVSGSLADIVSGVQVLVSGTQNSDGSLTAKSIDLRPNMVPQR